MTRRKLLFVVQRFGLDVPGGAEWWCRELAIRMAARGHDVHVLTSRARSYIDWSDHYDEGDEDIAGVHVHRLGVVEPRDLHRFEVQNLRAVSGSRPLPIYAAQEWAKAQGPHVAGFESWLAQHVGEFDVTAFFTYLYWTAIAGLPVASALGPTVLHPLAHDEPYLYQPLFDAIFRLPHALAFLTEEEEELVERRFRIRRPSAVTGVGVELDVEGDAARFRAAHGLGDRPYLVFVGRVDQAKGALELFDYFAEHKRRHPSDLALVYVGEPVDPLPHHPDVFLTGFVDDHVKHDALAGALALVQPSWFESFSIVLVEAWSHRIPALVQGRCAVLTGQARRSGGGLPYTGYPEFEAALELVVADPQLRADMGAAGRRYAESRYAWDIVLDRYERLLDHVTSTRATKVGS